MTEDTDGAGSDLSHMRALRPAVHRPLASLMFSVANWGHDAMGIGLEDLMWRLCPAHVGDMRVAEVKFRKDQ
jgi:hypothetical protein